MKETKNEKKLNNVIRTITIWILLLAALTYSIDGLIHNIYGEPSLAHTSFIIALIMLILYKIY